MLVITPPDSNLTDYDFTNTDCIEHPSSDIEILSCRVDPNSKALFISIAQGDYLNNKVIAIQTKGLAIRNPCVNFLSATNSQWTAYFLSKEWLGVGISLANAYLVINQLNMASVSMSLVSETAANVSSRYYPFDWFEIPY